ncbi:hypothetical protein KAR91_20895 [Candidatus Pacearchaeota archaeon]|nr:hypothetical protein [Candidatus Pacearchaeota archaeon]
MQLLEKQVANRILVNQEAIMRFLMWEHGSEARKMFFDPVTKTEDIMGRIRNDNAAKEG